MVTGPNADCVLVKNLGDVVGVQAIEIETEHAATFEGACWPVNVDAITKALVKR
jgi:hypothetical protein